MRTLRNLLIAGFIVAGLLALAGFRASLPHVLILQSGSEGSAWVHGLDLAFDRELQASRRPVHVERYYLRLDEPGADPDAVRGRVQDARRAIDRAKPDMLVAVDDEANALVARHVAAHVAGQPDLRVLYVSIDQPPARYGYDGRAATTGLSETLPLIAIRDAVTALRGVSPFMLERQPDRPLRVAALARDSETGRAELEQVRRFDWAPLQLVDTAAAGNFSDWQRTCGSWSGDADVVLVLSYRGLPREAGSTKPVAGTDLTDWMERECRPVPIGVSSGYVTDGGGLSIAPSPEEYGRIAARMALQWLETDHDATKLPAPRQASHFDVALRASVLLRRGLHLPPLYVEAANARNAYFD